MLNRFFIMIGDLALSGISSIKNFSFKDTDKENQEKNNEKINNIFSRLNLEVESKTSSQDVTFLDK